MQLSYFRTQIWFLVFQTINPETNYNGFSTTILLLLSTTMDFLARHSKMRGLGHWHWYDIDPLYLVCWSASSSLPGTQSRRRLQLPLLSFSSTSNSRDNLKQFSRRQNCVPRQNLSGELTGWVKVGLVEDAGSKLKTHLMKPLLLRRQAELEDRG